MKYFNESEFNEFDKMNSKLLLMLDNLREVYGYPITLTSTYRSPEHPIEVGFTRIGISRKKNFVHVGIGYKSAPSTTIWTY